LDVLQAHKPMLTFQLHFLYDVLYIIRLLRCVYAEHFAKFVRPPPDAFPAPVGLQSNTDASVEHEIHAAEDSPHASGSVPSPKHAADAQRHNPNEAAEAGPRPLKLMNVDLPFEVQVRMVNFSSLFPLVLMFSSMHHLCTGLSALSGWCRLQSRQEQWFCLKGSMLSLENSALA
jgi:hypothetical protein